MNASDNGSSEAENEKGKPYQDISSVVGPPASAAPELPPADQTNNKPKKRKWAKDPPMFWATVAGVIVVAAYATVAAWQACLMRDTISEMQAEQRPWIKPSVQLLGFRFTDKLDAQITYLLDYSNVGHSPALNVHTRVAGVVVTERNAIKSVRDENAQCALARRDSTNPEFPGLVLFPGEFAPHLIGGSGIGSADVSASEYAKAWPNRNSVFFKLVVCIDYSYGADLQASGAAAVSYSIYKRLTGNPNIETAFAPAPGDIPIQDIIFVPDPFSSGSFK